MDWSRRQLFKGHKTPADTLIL